MNSVLKNVVFLNIKINNSIQNTIEDIGAIKITDSNIFTYEYKARDTKDLQSEILDFIEDYPIIIHNNDREIGYLQSTLLKKDDNNNNLILDSKELSMILEPFHSNYDLEYLIRNITNLPKEKDNSSLAKSIDTLNIVNSLLVRLWDKEKSTLNKLYFNIDQIFVNSNIPKWEWTEYLKEDINININDIHVEYEHTKGNNFNNNYDIDLKEYKDKYEELLKIEKIWNRFENNSYIFRPRQYEFTNFIRNVFQSNSDEIKIGCIEAPTGIGKSVGYLVPAIMESYITKKRIIVSTDTKSLQMQLINKDIPTILKSMNLQNKISYGCMKGKNNYICKKNLHDYKKQAIFTHKNELLSLLLVERFVQDGENGDIEDLSLDIKNKFQNIDKLLYISKCESESCYPDKCIEKCFYKQRIKELKKEDITIINHSLLAKWPYKDQKSLEYIIVDEAHNLMEKSYDFFTRECLSIQLQKMLDDLYPSKIINKRNTTLIDKLIINVLNKIEFNFDYKKSLQQKIESIKEILNNILINFSNYLKNELYDHTWEINRQMPPINNESKIKKIDLNNILKLETVKLVEALKEIQKVLNYILSQCEKEGEDDSYIFNAISSKLIDLNEAIDTIEKFNENGLDDFCRIVDVNHEYQYFNLRVIPIDIAKLFESVILSNASTIVFLSATLNINNSMKNFKSILGLDNYNTLDKTIKPIYDYNGKTKIFSLDEFPTYNAPNDEFITKTADFIEQIVTTSSAHVLALFTSKSRLEKVYESLANKNTLSDVLIYKDKAGINNLKNLDKKCIVLGSKACFEGIDISGEGLTCVILDKLPNKNFDDPLYSSIRTYKKQSYDEINYPQLIIKAKQSYGRLIRSKYDYGYFIILDSGKNNNTISKLQRDLHNCIMHKKNSQHIIENINYDFTNWKKLTIREILSDINVDISNIEDISHVNRQIKNRKIKARIKDIDKINKKLKITYKY